MYNLCSETKGADQLRSHYIRITCPCNKYPLTPHFYIVKLGFTGVYILSYFCCVFFLFFFFLF